MIGVLTIDELNETVERALRIEGAKPILFNTPMVQAILDGTKTVTRRVLKPQPVKVIPADNEIGAVVVCGGSGRPRESYHVGDVLYVRETFSTWKCPDGKDIYIYKAADDNTRILQEVGGVTIKWHPSIHMPKEAARIFLRVTGVRAERLQDITEEQARAEGVKDPYDYQAPEWYEQRGLGTNFEIDAFAGLWDSMVKKADLDKYGWDANPWVRVIAFRRVEREEV